MPPIARAATPPTEAADAVKLCESAARHGIKTHNAIKALHLDDHFGSRTGGCVPGAEIEVLPSRFKATQVWNANRKLGQSVAYAAMETCMNLADEFGTGTVVVDNAFHYLWGGGYVIDAAQRGYIAYTNCTSALAEVVPFGGKFPTLGTNPHSWALPTVDAVGFPVCLDWATSTVAMGRVQQLLREGKPLPPECRRGCRRPTDHRSGQSQVAAALRCPQRLRPGPAERTLRRLHRRLAAHPARPPGVAPAGEKTTAAFFFHVIHPDAISSGNFALGRDQKANVAP